MTLDEKIEKEKRLAEINRKQAEEANDLFYRKDMQKSYRESNIKEAKEHEQLVEWLEELKSYRVAVFCGNMTQSMLKEEYNKAIDDFKFEVKSLINELCVIRFKDIDKIAERLKGGDVE